MPYFRCPNCGLSAHLVAGHSTARVCPECDAPVADGAGLHLAPPRRRGFHRRLAADPGAAYLARSDLKSVLADLDEDHLEVVGLLMSELINNGVTHGGWGNGRWVRLDVVLTDQMIRVEVRDEGLGLEVAAPRAPDPLDPHYGLYLVDELADRWGVVAERENLVWFEIDRNGDRRSLDR